MNVRVGGWVGGGEESPFKDLETGVEWEAIYVESIPSVENSNLRLIKVL
jgi:hypothetical protein